MIHLSRPQVGVGCIVIRNSELLLLKRRGSHGQGSWSTPGGYLDFGESLEDCASRETREETGLEVADVRFFAVTNDVFLHDDKHFVTVWMRAAYVGGEATPSPEASEIRWFDRSKLPEPLFLPLSNLIESHGLPDQ